MKRVLVVAPQPFFALRGTPINVRAVVSTLAAAGYDVTLLAMPFGDNIQIPGVRLLRVPRFPGSKKMPIGPSLAKILYSLIFLWTTFRLTSKERFDLLHGVEEAALIAGAVGLLRGIPYVVDVDSCMPTQIRSSWLRYIPGATTLFEAIESFFFRRAVAAITVCSALTAKVRRVAPGIPIYQIEDFPFADALVVDAAKFGELKRIFAAETRTKLLYTGNLEPYQGIELLIRALARAQSLNTGGQRLLLMVVGGSVDQITACRALASELGITTSIRFEGHRPAEEMGAYTAVADILVSPRMDGENVPLKLYTYLAVKKPLVATRILSHTQIVDDSSAYLGVPTVDGLADALLRAARSTAAELEATAARGLLLIQERYSEPHFKARLLAAYQQLLPLESVEPHPAGVEQLVLAE